MYVKRPVIENVYDSKILLAIDTNEFTVKQISKITNSHKPTIRRQIKKDLLKEYLIEKTLDKRGKTTYSVRWNRIVEDFLDYLKKLSKDKKLPKKEIEDMESKVKPMKNNKYLKIVLQLMFKEFSRIYLSHNLPITLEELFKEMIVSLGESLNPDVIRPKFYMALKEEKEFNDFIIFNYFLETYFSTMKIGMADLFYMELEKKSAEKSIKSSAKKI